MFLGVMHDCSNGTHETMTVLVQDLDSYNGVRVNGNRIVGQCSLAADDTIQIVITCLRSRQSHSRFLHDRM